jgi:membrane-associated phospholipid phosphatase
MTTAHAKRQRTLLLFLAIGFWSGLYAVTLSAQTRDSTADLSVDSVSIERMAPRGQATHTHVLRWYEGAAAIAGTSALMLLDEPVQRTIQTHRSSTSDDMAAVFRRMGQPEVYLTVTAGMVGVGLLAHDLPVTRAGERLFVALGLAGTSTVVGKRILGRARPSTDVDAFHFAPFSGNDAFPSGHTTMAFALATSLADDLHNTWASIGFYTIATGTAWSRLNDNKHWLSDVGLGAVVGVASAKLVDGRWRVFGLMPPKMLLAPNAAAGIGWDLTF